MRAIIGIILICGLFDVIFFWAMAKHKDDDNER